MEDLILIFILILLIAFSQIMTILHLKEEKKKTTEMFRFFEGEIRGIKADLDVIHTLPCIITDMVNKGWFSTQGAQFKLGKVGTNGEDYG